MNVSSKKTKPTDTIVNITNSKYKIFTIKLHIVNYKVICSLLTIYTSVHRRCENLS